MNLGDQLRRDEGLRYAAYRDTLGNWTTGVGHLILPSEGWLIGATLSDAQVDALLAHDIADTVRELIEFDWYTGLDAVRAGAVTNMGFNLGVPKLLHFPSMIHFLSVGDYPAAAAQALNSAWASQLHFNPADPLASRPGRIAAQIRTGAWQ